MSETTIDASQVTALERDLKVAGPKAVVGARKAVEVGARKIQLDLRREASGHPTFPAFPRSITYDVVGLAAEIGPDKNISPGPLGNILYIGTSRNGPVLPDPSGALQREAAAFDLALAQIGIDAVFGK